jgi:hypothetical protein
MKNQARSGARLLPALILAGGAAEAVFVLAAAVAECQMLGAGSSAFLLVPASAMVTAVHELRRSGLPEQRLILWLSLLMLLPINLAGFIAFLMQQGLGAP